MYYYNKSTKVKFQSTKTPSGQSRSANWLTGGCSNYLPSPLKQSDDLRLCMCTCVHCLTCAVRQKVINLTIDSKQWHTLAHNHPQTIMCSNLHALLQSDKTWQQELPTHSCRYFMLLVLFSVITNSRFFFKKENLTLLNLSPAVVLIAACSTCSAFSLTLYLPLWAPLTHCVCFLLIFTCLPIFNGSVCISRLQIEGTCKLWIALAII